jgi:hypothetical protein
MVAFLVFTRRFMERRFISILLQATGAALIYSLLFLSLAIGRTERDWYVAKIRQIIGRKRVPAA